MGKKDVKEPGRLELYVCSVREVKMPDNTVAYFTQVRIIDNELGVLLPEVYMPIAEKALKATEISFWAIKKAHVLIKRLDKNESTYSYIAFYCPEQFIANDQTIDKFLEFFKDYNESETPLKKIAFCFNPQTAASNNSTIYDNMMRLKEKGVRIIISGYGCEGFPSSVLLRMPADYVIPDKLILDCLKGTEQERQYAEGIIDIARRLGIKIIASDIKSAEDMDSLSDYCDFAMGDFLSKYRSDRYIKS